MSTPVEIQTTIIQTQAGAQRKSSALPPLSNVEITIFKDSTHQYLIYFGHTKDVLGLIIGCVAILIEWILFIIIIKEGYDLFAADRVPVEVGYSDCQANHMPENSGYPDDAMDSDILSANHLLICEANDESDTYATLGYALLAIYLMGDVIRAMKAFFSISGVMSKVGAIIIMATAILATYAGSLFAYQGVYTGSGYDAVVNCIGVLFVIDIDEQLFTALAHVEFAKNFQNSCISCLFCACCDSLFRVICISICAVLFVMFGFFAVEMGQIVQIDTP
jgi:hypothetical protein